jgi:hypothetical protein
LKAVSGTSYKTQARKRKPGFVDPRVRAGGKPDGRLLRPYLLRERQQMNRPPRLLSPFNV